MTHHLNVYDSVCHVTYCR